MPATFDLLILIGRPASGKSEIIDFLKHLPAKTRRERYHLVKLDILDDFPMLWAWFEEDALLTRRFNRPRLHTDEDGYFINPDLWHVLIERLDLDYQKRRRDQPAYHRRNTTLVEFSRGSQHGGYAGAFPHFSDELLGRAVVLYVRVPFEEASRKNRLRYNPQRPDSILEHGLSDSKMEQLYHLDDWETFSQADPVFLHVRDVSIPYAVFENGDDVTTGKPDLLASRLETTLDYLWKLRHKD
ncbi:MAG: hypothetical protein A2X25_05490 [Chloroflexi bacterium GWB2_49_20]|nr:MAG: hypothetical protein A2X25_05490 [Chloroflexi bacterium GWB2_49_20]OGN77079.1 MAG: hypothetical protein A2X26_06490 [Chloroflexi bacterium GWC2_49_37]OGN83805.1 MAG: hypothetical protein A2X27_02090 [Chloroflexi bacterium GWD2_49_16]